MAEEVSIKVKIDDKGAFKKVSVDANDLQKAIKHVKSEVDLLNKNVINFTQTALSINLLQQSISQVAGVFRDLSAAYATQLAARYKAAKKRYGIE